uniref:HTH cro/C1-type domain-containing protein n=1 Tax=Thermosporothrix sp. COM3 TaxID=2490863 RepID=A0A455SMY6_9CHLR|nr:hypothetical protein KTC_23260 [Thermosporothrix sp. COM3]
MPVKRADCASPNLLLKRARLEKCWTQQDVARLLGVPQNYMVSRWENGTSSPSLKYQQKLCQLFSMNPEDLGFLPAPSASPVYDPMIPARPSHIRPLFGRDRLLATMKQLLLNEQEGNFIALYGLPGVGKTALPAELAADAEVRDHFKDGILWANSYDDVQETLQRWCKLLDLPEQTDREQMQQQLRSAVSTRRILFVFDNVWSLHEIQHYYIGGSHCAYLLTTRSPRIAAQFASTPALLLHVPELTSEESIAFLLQLAPALHRIDARSVQQLVRKAAGLPLILNMMGMFLVAQAHTYQNRRIVHAVEQLLYTDTLLQLPLFFMHLSTRSSTSSPTLKAVLDESIGHLPGPAREALASLSLFPASFSEEAALFVTAKSAQELDTLVDAGLIEVTAMGRYRMHPLLAGYARTFCTEEAIQRFCSYFLSLLRRQRELISAQDIQNSIAALEYTFSLRLKKLATRKEIVHHYLMLSQRYPEQTRLFFEQTARQRHHCIMTLRKLSKWRQKV